MAPEIWAGKKLTYSVDFYSLGILLYELVLGENIALFGEQAHMRESHPFAHQLENPAGLFDLPCGGARPRVNATLRPLAAIEALRALETN